MITSSTGEGKKKPHTSSLLPPYRQRQQILYGQAEAHFWWVKSRRYLKQDIDTSKDLSISCQSRGAAAPLTNHSSSVSNYFLQTCLSNSSTATSTYDQQDTTTSTPLWSALSRMSRCLISPCVPNFITSNTLQTNVAGVRKIQEET